MNIHIPGYNELEIKYLVFDYNGTLAVDGEIPEEVQNKILALAPSFHLLVLTADTYGNVEKACQGLPIKVHTFTGDSAAQAKKEVVENLSPQHCACFGNGRNDQEMLKIAGLSVCVIGKEGAYGQLMQHADICVTSILDAMDLFLLPNRIVADLRG